MPYGPKKTFRPNVHNAAVQQQSLRSVFIRFNELLCKAGSEHNRSRFIVKRSFCEEFTATKRDPSKTQSVGRRNDFYFQFQQLANNYSQVVKIVNQHFSNVEYKIRSLAWRGVTLQQGKSR